MKQWLPFICVATFVSAVNLSAAQGHSLEELQRELGKTEGDFSESLLKMTQAYEQQPAGPVCEQLHSAQHGMILEHQCSGLLAKLSSATRRIAELQRAGQLEKAQKLQQWADQAHGYTSVSCLNHPE